MTVVDYTAQYIAQAFNATEVAMTKTMLEVEAEAKRLASQAPSPPPSAPGEPPHVETGTLVRSISSRVEKAPRTSSFQRGEVFIGRVGTSVKYGDDLERGTRKMAARPFLRPALDAKGRNTIPHLRAELRRIKSPTRGQILRDVRRGL